MTFRFQRFHRDTVNTAARMESTGEVNRVNISKTTYERVAEDFVCTPRGKLKVKGKGQVEMFFVEGVKQNDFTTVSSS